MGQGFDGKNYYDSLDYNQKIEIEITQLCWKPLSVYDIGQIINMTPKNVKKHVHRMVRKGMLNVIVVGKTNKYIRNLNMWTDV